MGYSTGTALFDAPAPAKLHLVSKISPMSRKNDRIDTIPVVLLYPVNKPMSKESDLKEHYSDIAKILFRNA